MSEPIASTSEPVDEQPTLRAEHSAATRDRITRAVLALLADEHPAALSIPAVARRAGVSVATIYRHFPSKEQLLDAVAAVDSVPSGAGLPEPADTVEEFTPAIGRIFATTSERVPLIYLQLASPLGREIRKRRVPARIEYAERLVSRWGIEPKTPEGERLVNLAVAITSAAMFIELHERAGIPVEQATAYVGWAVETLTHATEAAQAIQSSPSGESSTKSPTT